MTDDPATVVHLDQPDAFPDLTRGDYLICGGEWMLVEERSGGAVTVAREEDGGGVIAAADPPATAADVANYFIWRANADEEFGDNITNSKLQKLVYYAQGFHLAWYGTPLFAEPIEAWAHGPVVRPLHFKFQAYGAAPIPTPAEFDPASLDEQTRELLEDVYQVYGQYSAWGLRNLTHDEPPWKDTPPNEVIPTEAMQRYFKDTLTHG